MTSNRDINGYRIRLNEAVNALAQYFGLYTTRDLAGRIAFNRIQGFEENSSADFPPPPPEVTRLIELIIDTSTGGYTTARLIELLNSAMTATQGNQSIITEGNGSPIVRFNNLIKIFYGQGAPGGANKANRSNQVLIGSSNTPEDSISTLLGNSTINSNIRNPSRDVSPGLGVVLMNSIRITPSQKNVNACTIFLNGIPNLEIAKALPFVDITFQFGRPPTDVNNRIQNMSLFKFLEGASIAPDGGSLRLLLDSNTTLARNRVDNPATNTQADTLQTYSLAGMEVFTAPQTLVNANIIDDPLIRSAPVLDKFKPFLTFKSFKIDVQPTMGLMCFKTAKLELTLHDRSRLAEIADFIRPDLYSNSELFIEYGWNHPEKPNSGNHYANLINGMRCREKYGITNVSFGFDDAGQINLNIDLAMRGATDFDTESISSDERGVSPIIREIQDLSRAIGELRRRTFQQGVPGAREVRGIQILDTASDSSGQILLSPESRTALLQFRNAMNNIRSQNSNVQELLNSLTRLYGPNARQPTGLMTQLRSTVQDNIARKLQRVTRGRDSFFVQSTNPHLRNERQGGRGRLLAENRGQDQSVNRQISNLNISSSVTLGKLLLFFIGEPLAMTGKFDDVQLVFYPFNSYAGFANSLNIANFLVDTRYFLQQYTRYRTESTSRAGNMSLRDFLTFIAQTIIDDPSATSYGLRDARGEFYRTPRTQNRSGGTETNPLTVESAVGDSAALQVRIENLLRTVTPDGTFRLPQIDFYIETLSENQDSVEDGRSSTDTSSKSILKIHIFDRQTTSYDTQMALMAANRDEELRTIGNLPIRQGGERGIVESQEQLSTSILSMAQSAGLIEKIAGSDMYRISGGPRRLKEFLMKTSPYIIYGAQGSLVRTANVSTIQDAALSTVNLLRSYQGGPLEPNGENPGGLPLQVIPAEMTMDVFGCPLLNFAQQFFIDFQTGTTIDNYYTITGLTHTFEPGNFSTGIKFSFSDAWGRYSSFMDTVRNASTVLTQVQASASPTSPGTSRGGNIR